jgi:superfamily II DNA/RNA helicase
MTVLDEADHLCDLGFYPSVDKLVGLTPAGSQRLLLSATLDGDVDRLVSSHLREPRVHELDPNAGSIATMTHHTLTVGGFRDKTDALTALVRANGRTIVFTRTRESATQVAEALTAAGVPAVDLQGSLSQRVRERNLERFATGRAQVVVATDVAARGIHVDDVGLVVHFDAAGDAKSYLHRSGRTARAGRDGCVVTLTTPRQVHGVVRLQQNAGVEVLHHDLRSAPKPMTAEALAAAGHPGPVRTRDSATRSPAGRRSSASSGRSGRRGPATHAAGRAAARRGGRRTPAR